MQYVCLIKHKNNYFELFEYKGIYLHPYAGKNLFPRGKGIKKWSYNRLCSHIALQMGLNKKDYPYWIKKFQNEDDDDSLR